MREGEERRIQPKIRLRSCGQLAAQHTGNDTALKDLISCKLVFPLRKRVFWVAAMCGWVIAS
jgi:hypothetical protein